MNKIIFASFSIILVFNSVYGQTNDEKYAEDVKSVDAIINAYYDVVSGSSNKPWEFERYIFIRKMLLLQDWTKMEKRNHIPLKRNIYQSDYHRKRIFTKKSLKGKLASMEISRKFGVYLKFELSQMQNPILEDKKAFNFIMKMEDGL